MTSKINIIIPQDHPCEREYILKVFFDFLKIPYALTFDNTVENWIIHWNDKQIIIRDCFFSEYKNSPYLQIQALPDNIIFGKNIFTSEIDIPIIYGTEEFSIRDNEIICGIDLFASSFFMLSRWEEYMNKKKDIYDRFPGQESIAYKYGFLHRPVVNEYIEMFWNMLRALGYSGSRGNRNYELILTHDIDYLQSSKRILLRSMAGDILKRRNLGDLFHRIHDLLGEDPFICYDWLMQQSENIGSKSHFYFMSSSVISPFRDTEFYLHRKKFKTIISKIKQRGHIIGFHPGFYSYNNPELWKQEKKNLENIIECKVIEGRQHYLKIDIPVTLQQWENNKMQLDSTLGYYDIEGFRCGTGDIFQIFDFINQKTLNLREMPLIIMDGTLTGYRKYNLVQALDTYKHYIEISQKYQSKLTLLFHNSSFNDIEWKGWKELYISVLKISKNV